MKVVKIVQAGENGNIVIIEEKDQKRWLQQVFGGTKRMRITSLPTVGNEEGACV